jgi:transposase
LVDQRRPVAQRTAIGNKPRWFLHELDPKLAVASRGLRRLYILAQALIQHHRTLAAFAAELVADCPRLSPLDAAAVVECILVYARGPK